MKRKRILIQCSSLVDRNAVSRKNINGVEHVIINSHTLPDDIVMNGGLYLAAEIANSFETLERTLAPVEHPTNSKGDFISANDPAAIHNFYAGAFNENVRRENGRVSLDKVINVQEALKTDRGKRLLDRVDELETSDDPRPIHTSTGVFLEVEDLDVIQTNAAGQEYTWIARNMVFDHDAILLESIAAAQPHQGVGMAVNREGDAVSVQRFMFNTDNGEGAKTLQSALRKALSFNKTQNGMLVIAGYLDRVKTNQALVTIDADSGNGLSHDEVREALNDAISRPPLGGDWVLEIFEDVVIFMAADVLFSAPYSMEGKIAKIIGIPLPVERDVNFVPKTNRKGDAMKDLMLKALKDLMLKALAAAGVTVNAEISDEDLLVKYNEFTTSQSSKEEGDTDMAIVVANAVTEAIKPITEKIENLETKVNEQSTKEHSANAEIVGNSDKYPGLSVDEAKKLDAEILKGMVANCTSAYGVPLNSGAGDGQQSDNEPFEMPK